MKHGNHKGLVVRRGLSVSVESPFSRKKIPSYIMPLLSIWNSNPETVSEMSIVQIVATAGNGHLLDGSQCSTELRQYLSEVSSDKLAEYAEYCLNNRSDDKGKVLQD